MQENLTRAQVADALGVTEAAVTAFTVEPPRKGEKPLPVPEPKRYAYEQAVEVSRVGDIHVVFRRTRVWGDERQIYSAAVSEAICRTEAEAEREAARLETRITA